MAYKYSAKGTENSAKAVGRALPISTKYSVEVCNLLRGKKLERAKTILENVQEQKQAVPLKRYGTEVPHKKGMLSGRYPIKCCKEIHFILKSAESNAQLKGLNTAQLKIKHISAQKGPKTMHHGRHGRKSKRTHIEVILEEEK
jgi:large subunit ribosomal protein L22